MLNRIRIWWRNWSYGQRLKKYRPANEAYKKVLGLVNLDELEDEMKAGDRRDYVARAAQLQDVWEREWSILVKSQINEHARTLHTDITLERHYGAMNIAELMHDRMHSLVAENNEYLKESEPEEIDPLNPISSNSNLNILTK